MTERDKLDNNPERDENELERDDSLQVEIGDEWKEGGAEEKAAAEAIEREEAAAQAAAAKPAQPKLPWVLFAASVAAIIGLVLFYNQGGGLQGAAAKVNGETVTKAELYDAMLAQSGAAALDSLVMEKLIVQEAGKKNIKATDQDIDAELAEIKKNFPEEAQFQAALEQNNLTLDKLKNQIRTNVLMTKIFEGQMDLSEAKQKEFFDKNKARYGTPEEIDVSHILVEKKEVADKLLADLKAGADFAAKAKELSTDPGSKDNGGVLGPYSRGGGFDETFENAAFKLEKGAMSEVVQTQFGFHIIKVTDKKAAVVASYDEKKDQVRKDMVNDEMGAKAEEWLQKLKTDAKIEKL